MAPGFSTGLNSSICIPEVRLHRFALNNPIPTSLEANLLVFSNRHGNTSSVYLKKRLTHAPGGLRSICRNLVRCEQSARD